MSQIDEARDLEKRCKLIIAFPSQDTDRLTFEEFDAFVVKVNDLRCRIHGSDQLNNISKTVKSVICSTLKHLESDQASTASELRAIIDKANALKFINFDFQLEQLKSKFLQADWLEKYKHRFEERDLVELSDVTELIDKGLKIPSSSPVIMEKITSLKLLHDAGAKFIETINRSLRLDVDEMSCEDQDLPSLDFLNAIRSWHNRTEGLAKLNLEPFYSSLTDLIEQAQNWKEKAGKICNAARNFSGEKLPMLKNVEDMVENGKKIGCVLTEHRTLEAFVKSAKVWIEDLIHTMIDRVFKFYRPIDAIIPRTIESSNKILTSRSFYLLLIRKGPFKESCFEQQLKGDFSNSKIKDLYDNFVDRESVYFEEVRSDKNLNRRKLVEMISGNQNIDNCSERFCFCGKDIKGYMIECQLCLDWYHLSCASDKNLIRSTESVNTQQLFICCLCTRGKRPKLKEIDALMTKLKKLSVRTIEGELFKCYRKRVQLWIERLHRELKNYPELKLLYSGKSNDTGAISDEIKTILEDLLFQAYTLGVDLDEIASLWKVFVILNPKRKTVVWYAGIPSAKRKGLLCWESKNRKNKKAATSANDENGKPDKGFAAHSYDDDADYHYAYEACAMKDGCMKPNGKELHWIACDQCSKWFHQICQGILKPLTDDEMQEKPYYCGSCRSTNPNLNS